MSFAPWTPIAADCRFRRTDSPFRRRASLFYEEQGIGSKLLNPLVDRLPKTGQNKKFAALKRTIQYSAASPG